ncbi:hypothetical protein FPD46_07865 [Campylobacter peloridis]|uniref:Uncharacterized protein n=1 Tax=Campylobacter peloridis TaxID=488546 RepID=A0A5C7DMC3_9BACT|nr:hypothetical protein [Campylobacter peloridis]TXE78488.1 hypothetical protein FPD46_07865 [Campylobacter peloridis]
MGQNLSLKTKIQVSDLFFTIGVDDENQKISYFNDSWDNNLGTTDKVQGYYEDNYRKAVMTSYKPSMELYLFGFESYDEASSMNYTYTYTSAYGGSEKYNGFTKYTSYIFQGSGKEGFDSNKWGILLAHPGGINPNDPSMSMKNNGIYTFKTTYKGKTYTSILHLKLSE